MKSFDEGSCSQSRRQIFNASIGAQNPRFANTLMCVIASDWRASGIINARSGAWLVVTTTRDIAGTGITPQRVNNRNNSIEGPGFWTADVAFSRLVSLAATRQLELRVEIFNLFNNFNWGKTVTNFDAGTFGRITSSAGDPRIMQFGIKYGF